MSLPCFPDDQLFLVSEEDFRFYKADAELPSASAAFQPQPRTTAANSSHEQAGGSAERVASGEPNSSQFWEETVGPRGGNESTSSSTFLLFGWPEMMLVKLALNWRTWLQFAVLQGDWVAVGACGLDGARQLTDNLTRRTRREKHMGPSISLSPLQGLG